MQSIRKFKVIGKASKSLVATIKVSADELNKDLLTLLQENNLPIASSCVGQGACHKCVINDCERSCMISAGDFLKCYGDEITVSYL